MNEAIPALDAIATRVDGHDVRMIVPDHVAGRGYIVRAFQDEYFVGLSVDQARFLASRLLAAADEAMRP